MIIQVYINYIVKEYFFADNVMDGRYKLQLYTQETGLDNDIEFYIDVNNGVKRIAGREVNVIIIYFCLYNRWNPKELLQYGLCSQYNSSFLSD